jgi:hypothetical protein
MVSVAGGCPELQLRTMIVLIRNKIQLMPLNARTVLQFLQDDGLAMLPDIK